MRKHHQNLIWELVRLETTCHCVLIFVWQIKIVKEFNKVLNSRNTSIILPIFPAFLATVDNVCCCTETSNDSCVEIILSWNKVSWCYIVATGLWTLWCHVEPECRCEHSESVRVHLVRVFKQVHYTVIFALYEHFREGSIVIVPWQLERSSSIILLSVYRRVSITSPIICFFVVTRGSSCTPLWLSACPFSNVPKTLSPLRNFIPWIMIACLLSKVCEKER